MSDLVVAASVTRAELGLADLSLEVPKHYRIVSAGPGGASWRRELTTSPFVHGQTLIGAVRDVQRAPLVIRVFGSTTPELHDRTNSLIDAFSQFEYSLTIMINGVAWQWTCEPADFAVGDGGAFEPHGLASLQQLVTLDIPRSPLQTAGGF